METINSLIVVKLVVYPDRKVKIWTTEKTIDKETNEELSSDDKIFELEKNSNVDDQPPEVKEICQNAWL
jgi:hypothetical protein